jgi:hypothetical protein
MQPDSARYDPRQTPAERNAFENLILMCGTHHTVIDSDEEAYTVERVRKMKADHEARATPMDDGTAEKIAASYVVVSTIGQIGGVTANQITGSTFNLNTGQIVDPALLRRQLNARETLWNIIVQYRSDFGLILYTDNIFVAKELHEYFAEGKHAKHMNILSEYRVSQAGADKLAASNPDKERPFISPKLWSIMFAIRAFYGRSAVLIHWSYERRAYQDWRTDKGVDQILGWHLAADAITQIKAKNIGGLTLAVDHLQNLFLSEAGMQGNQ